MDEDIVTLWCAWADRVGCANLVYKEDFRALAGNLPANLIEELGKFYLTALIEQHVQQLNLWLSSAGLRVPMKREERAVRNLILLFTHLGIKRYRPFSQQKMRHEHLLEADPDWSLLPGGLEFLASPATMAERFQYSFSELGREAIRRDATELERAAFFRAAKDVKAASFFAVKSWYSKLGVSEHREASMVFNLMAVLDALEMPYC